MGRPRKIVEGVTPPEAEPTTPEENIVEPKACLKCGGSATAKKDRHGYWRCHCDECSYWDSMVYKTEALAVVGWNASGDPHDIGL
ncbi:hypothetical protein CCP3SC15_3760003 [Gammaproteobacteria bacterium]